MKKLNKLIVVITISFVICIYAMDLAIMDMVISNLLKDKKNYSKKDYNKFFKKNKAILGDDMYRIYEKLEPFADNGNNRAIETIIYMHTQNMLYVYTDCTHIMKYYAKIPHNPHMKRVFGADLRKLFEEKPYAMFGYFSSITGDMKNKMDEMAKKISTLEKDNTNLRAEMKYMPPGAGFRDAEKEFKMAADASFAIFARKESIDAGSLVVSGNSNFCG